MLLVFLSKCIGSINGIGFAMPLFNIIHLCLMYAESTPLILFFFCD